MVRFQLHRDRDPSGVSGLGVVAEGVIFADGSTVMQWLGPLGSIVINPHGIAAVLAVHGHGGATRVVYLDTPDEG